MSLDFCGILERCSCIYLNNKLCYEEKKAEKEQSEEEAAGALLFTRTTSLQIKEAQTGLSPASTGTTRIILPLEG